MMLTKLVLLSVCAVVAVNGAVYTWIGRPTNFDDDLNWQGPNPTKSPGPAEMNLGIVGGGDVTMDLGNTPTYSMGKIVFNGPSTLVFSGSEMTSLSFNDKAEGTSTFTPDSDFNCNQRWLVTQGGSTYGAPNPPCGKDTIFIPDDASYHIEIPKPDGVVAGGIRAIQFGSPDNVLKTCPVVGAKTVSFPGFSSSVGFPAGCDETHLGKNVDRSCPMTSCTTTTTTSSTTSSTSSTSSSTTSSSTSSTITSTTTSTSSSSTNTPTITGYKVDAEGNIIYPTDANGEKIFVTNREGQFLYPTDKSGNPITEVPNDEAQGLFQTAAGTSILAAIVVVGLLIVIAIVVVTMLVIGRGSRKDNDRAIHSFDNPMYDDPQNASNVQQGTTGYMDMKANDGLYDDPMMANDANDDDDDDDDDDNYDTVDNTNTGGYMDIAPQDANNDDFDDDDDDEEDEDYNFNDDDEDDI